MRARTACGWCLGVAAMVLSCEPGTPPSAPVDPEFAAQMNSGAALMGQFDFDKAAVAFEAALAMDPANPWAKLDRAIAVMNQPAEGSQARAIELLAPLASDPHVGQRSAYCTALCNLYLGDHASALAILQPLAVENPLDAFVAYYLAQAQELGGSFASAEANYRRACELDPYLRSATLGLQRLLARAGDEAAAQEQLALFDRLSRNPRSTLAQFKYTRMGPLAEVALGGPATPSGSEGEVPEGSFFGTPVPLRVDSMPDGWKLRRWGSAADLNGDSRTDLICLMEVEGGICHLPLLARDSTDGLAFEAAPSHPLTSFREVENFWWADINNDGLLDAVATPRAPSPAKDKPPVDVFWVEQLPGGEWAKRSLGESAAGLETVAALADFDHDGDVDVLAHTWMNPTREFRILYNRLSEPWEGVSLPTAPQAASATLVDIDGDSDLDIVTVGAGVMAQQSVSVILNDRLWKWSRDSRYQEFESHPLMDAVAWVDPDTGLAMIAAMRRNFDHGTGPYADLCVFEFQPQAPTEVARRYFGLPRWMAAVDATGDGRVEILVDGQNLSGPMAFFDTPLDTVNIYDPRGVPLEELEPAFPKYSMAVPLVLAGKGLVLVGGLQIAGPGPARGDVATLSFSGRVDPAQQLRSNTAGIGTTGVARVGQRWSGIRQLPWNTHSGQSTDPCIVGLGTHGARDSKIDFIQVDWPDGVMQSERSIGPGHHTIVETQRQISSCPVVFVRDGAQMRFVTDSLGVGGLGYLATVVRSEDGTIAPVYAPPRPWEIIAIPSQLLGSAGDPIEIALAEPMEELTALDRAGLRAYDLPAGWQMALDERMGIGDPQPTGDPIFWRTAMMPERATVKHGNGDPLDQLAQLSLKDGIAVDPGPIDPRFIGRTSSPYSLEITFPEPITGHVGRPVLLMDGWIEYPYCQTNFAMWQAGATLSPPTFEALDPSSGQWVMLAKEYGYPAGMAREAAFPLDRTAIPDGARALRISTNHELYIDRCRIVYGEPCPGAVVSEAPLRWAIVLDSGFARRIPAPQRRPQYDYQSRLPLWDCRKQVGWYTQLGEDCAPLVSEIDDAVAIFAGGEEIRLRFGALPVTPNGMTRWYALELAGWCKDMDMLTGDGARVDPLPRRAAVSEPNPRRDELHRRFNTRREAGR